MKRQIEEIGILLGKKARSDDGDSAMLLLKPSDVPEYLRESEFYRSLDIEENDTFSIPASHMKANTAVETLEDACELLRTVRFWCLDISLMPVFDYAITQPHCEIEEKLTVFEDGIPFVKAVLSVSKNKDSVRKMIGAAMECGCMEIVSELSKRATASDYSEKTVTQAAAGGSIECLLFAQSKMGEAFQTPYSAYESTVANGHLECLKVLCQQYEDIIQCPFPDVFSADHSLYQALVAAAIEHSQLECLTFMHERGASVDRWATYAALNDKMVGFKYVVEHSDAYLSQDRNGVKLYHATLRKNYECLMYLHELKPAWLKDVCLDAVETGHVHLLQFYIQNGGEWHPWTCHAAALHNHLDCLKFACENRCPTIVAEDNLQQNTTYCERFEVNELPSHLVAMVAQRKHWECARYLIEQNHPLTPGLTPQLAYNKQDDLLRLAVQHGCPLPTEVAVIYARRGYLEGLVFVLEHGCKPSSHVPWGAARCGRLPCLVYAHEHGCLLDEFVCVGAARGGHLDCLQYVYEQGVRWGEDVCKAAVKGGNAGCVQYAREHVVNESEEDETSSGCEEGEE